MFTFYIKISSNQALLFDEIGGKAVKSWSIQMKATRI